MIPQLASIVRAKEGSLGAITSPPYSEAQSGGGILKNGYQGSRPGGKPDSVKDRTYHAGNTSIDPANIARLPIGAITSPPYGNRVDDHGVDQPGYEGQSERLGRYGTSEGQLGNRRIGGITSPPYEEGLGHGGRNSKLDITKRLTGFHDQYGQTEGQIGQESTGTYWSACEQVYRQVWELFSPGSHMAVVVKAFVRNKKIVPLPEMTLQLLRHIGFEPVLWVDASLVGETQPSMFAGIPDYTRKRVSFFRRLHEKKHPETAINEEVVLIVKRP